LRILLDSSTLIAAIVETHPKHNVAFPLLKDILSNHLAFISSHSLLEIYSILTIAPFKPPITPSMAKNSNDFYIKKSITTITLDSEEYFELISGLSKAGFQGGIVYDALILECAKKANIDQLITLNSKDFKRLNSENRIEIIAI